MKTGHSKPSTEKQNAPIRPMKGEIVGTATARSTADITIIVRIVPENFIRKYVRPRWKVFLKPEALPINWFEDPRNISDYKQDDIQPAAGLKDYEKHVEINIMNEHEQSPLKPSSETRHLCIQNSEMATTIRELRKEVKTLKQKIYRRDRTLTNMQSLLKNVKQKNLTDKQTQDILERLPGASKPVFKRLVGKINGQAASTPYDEDLREFSVQLDFRSPISFRFVREAFGNCLPHPSSVTRWYQSLDCNPGFTQETLSTVKSFVVFEKAQGKTVTCQLVFDEINIFSHVQQIGEKMYGQCFAGDVQDLNDLNDTNSEKATQILVFMIVSIDLKWKVPISYFPTQKLDASQKANLIVKAVYQVLETGVRILGVTFDAAPENFKAMSILGTNLETNMPEYKLRLQKDPQDNCPSAQIFIQPDVVHMIKLTRNTFARYKMYDGQGREINYQYIIALHELQSTLGINLDNKIRTAHVAFKGREMNVRLAVELLSESVADSLDFCRDHLNYKGSITDENFEDIQFFCQTSVMYIDRLQIVKKNGRQLVVKSANCKGFVGLRACLTNLPHIYEEVKNHIDSSGLRTYSLNQDHLEMFFGAVRTRLGCNTNPSVIQFRAAYKRLITHVQIEAKKGNCLSGTEVIKVLSVSSSRSLRYLNGHIQKNKTNTKFNTEEDVEKEIRVVEDIEILKTDEVAALEENISEALESVIEIVGVLSIKAKEQISGKKIEKTNVSPGGKEEDGFKKRVLYPSCTVSTTTFLSCECILRLSVSCGKKKPS
uniref:THAP-type domain-containing protein n=1 Tax=Phlebotomus papatasi TaxID=29031 RepID=A0A1B0DQL7_PHLPP